MPLSLQKTIALFILLQLLQISIDFRQVRLVRFVFRIGLDHAHGFDDLALLHQRLGEVHEFAGDAAQIIVFLVLLFDIVFQRARFVGGFSLFQKLIVDDLVEE